MGFLRGKEDRMTANTATWGLTYQTFTDPADISQSIQDLADTADTAVQSLYDAQAIGAAKPAMRAATTATQSIPDNTNTNLTWGAGSESFDNDSMWDDSVTNDTLVFTHAGIYLVSLRCTFLATASGGGVRQIAFTHSSLGLVARNAQLGTVSDGAVLSTVAVVPVYVAGQTMTFQALQTSSAALNTATKQLQSFRLSTL
jgi:hypothetical protein